MKVICVSMSKKEQVLDSYLLRVFGGEQIDKGNIKTIRFPVENLESNPAWSIQRFKNFCNACVSDKKSLIMYRARIEVSSKNDKSLHISADKKQYLSKEQIISSWKDKDEFELLAHLRILARPGNTENQIREHDILLDFYRKTYIEGREDANS